MDNIDKKIISALISDGRLTNAKLAEKVGLSPSPCWQRLRRLENDGLIEGYGARVNHKALGVSETAFVEISLEKHDDETLERFNKAVENIPEIVEVHLMTGEFDYIIKVMVRDTQAFEVFLRKRLYPITGIRHSRTSFSLGCIKRTEPCVETG